MIPNFANFVPTILPNDGSSIFPTTVNGMPTVSNTPESPEAIKAWHAVNNGYSASDAVRIAHGETPNFGPLAGTTQRTVIQSGSADKSVGVLIGLAILATILILKR